MKIGAKVTFFNAKMRERRKELGLSQKELGELCGVSATAISGLEILKLRAPTAQTKKLLFLVADALDCDLEYIFPEDYLNAMELRKELAGILPWSGKSLIFIREVRLDRLSPGEEISGLLMPSAEEDVCENILCENIREILDDLPERERDILKMRFGIGGGETISLREISKIYGITKERVRQIENMALSRLRHPRIRRNLREWKDE